MTASRPRLSIPGAFPRLGEADADNVPNIIIVIFLDQKTHESGFKRLAETLETGEPPELIVSQGLIHW